MKFRQSLLPAQSHTSFRERLRAGAGAGAFVALRLTGRVIGIVTQSDFLDRSRLDDFTGVRMRLRSSIRRWWTWSR